jgi:nicotinate-nucleotide pyrophosphorylase (carboxylating)
VSKLNPELMNCVRADVERALREDIGDGDVTAQLVPAEQRARAQVIAREAATLCGQPWFDEVFRQLDSAIEVRWQIKEGANFQPNDVICQLTGPARAMLTGERAALNFLQTLSATATTAAAFSSAVANTATIVLDTRKTVPGLRLAQKYAVKTGGAANHRIGLYDGILIKENHIFSGGGITNTVTAALNLDSGVMVEVEVENLNEAREAMAAGAHRLLLDNFDLADMAAAVAIRDSDYTNTELEASGNVSLKTIREIAGTGVDYVSIGALTKDIKAIDYSMRFEIID